MKDLPPPIDDHQEDDDSTLISEELQRSRRKDLATETMRKTLMAMGDDVRVVLIKLADRLHNMRTLSYIPESKRKRICERNT